MQESSQSAPLRTVISGHHTQRIGGRVSKGNKEDIEQHDNHHRDDFAQWIMLEYIKQSRLFQYSILIKEVFSGRILPLGPCP